MLYPVLALSVVLVAHGAVGRAGDAEGRQRSVVAQKTNSTEGARAVSGVSPGVLSLLAMRSRVVSRTMAVNMAVRSKAANRRQSSAPDGQ